MRGGQTASTYGEVSSGSENEDNREVPGDTRSQGGRSSFRCFSCRDMVRWGCLIWLDNASQHVCFLASFYKIKPMVCSLYIYVERFFCGFF